MLKLDVKYSLRSSSLVSSCSLQETARFSASALMARRHALLYLSRRTSSPAPAAWASQTRCCTALRYFTTAAAPPPPPPRPPLPPFTLESAVAKVRAAEDAWNSCDPSRVALAYTPDTRWRNRDEFFTGRAEVETFLTWKWATEREYRLIKELWAVTGSRIAVRFVYEWRRGDGGAWRRSHGNENWDFDDKGYMRVRHASINDVPISEGQRLFRWPRPGPRPADHPGLSDLGL